ncbi:MAG: 6-pyruvoyl tetrahydropterin synthase family protein [Pirellulales bacterium]
MAEKCIESYSVRVGKDYLVFSAAHFITYDGNTCEPLHGHNYRVSAEVFGPLDENHYVIDYIALRDAVKQIVDRLDHRLLLPTDHPSIRVTATESEVEAKFEQRRWLFPRSDCVLLPIANTTSELLARYIGQQLLEQLEQRTGARPGRLRIEVDDCFGQVAVATLES